MAPILKFPEPTQTTEDGLLAVGGDLHPDSLLLAYGQGIFPWPIFDPETKEHVLAWFCPPERALLEFKDLHVPKSLERARKKNIFRFTIDQDFPQVIRACGEVRKLTGTWITPELEQAYLEFHRLGHAHSVEVWQNDALVGGVYGVTVGGAFAAESMFYKKPNASKLALLHLMDHLNARGLTWIDIQMMTPHMQALGAKTESRQNFLRRLSQTRLKSLTTSQKLF